MSHVVKDVEPGAGPSGVATTPVRACLQGRWGRGGCMVCCCDVIHATDGVLFRPRGTGITTGWFKSQPQLKGLQAGLKGW